MWTHSARNPTAPRRPLPPLETTNAASQAVTPGFRHQFAEISVFAPDQRRSSHSDPLEREANDTADRWLAGQALGAPLHTAPVGLRLQACGSCDGKPLEEKCPRCQHDALEQRVPSGGGQALDSGVAASVGAGLGHDFADIRVHTGDAATGLARSQSALAYATGRDLVFDAGQYRPDTRDGQWLLAHELTHVVQQAQGGAVGLQRFPNPFEDPLGTALCAMNPLACVAGEVIDQLWPDPAPAPYSGGGGQSGGGGASGSWDDETAPTDGGVSPPGGVPAPPDHHDVEPLKKKWGCSDVRCNVQPTKPGNTCPERVIGNSAYIYGTESEACSAAESDANSQVPQGCYKRHCNCNSKCSQL